MIIVATRMHRYLVDYASKFPDVYDTLNLLYVLSYSTRAMPFQGWRTGKPRANEQYRILKHQTGPGCLEFTLSDRCNGAYGFRATYNNTGERL
jgi:hypothetical protein